MSVSVVLGCGSGCVSSRFVRLRDEPRGALTERFRISVSGACRTSKRTQRFLVDRGSSGRGTPAELLELTRELHRGQPSVESTHALAELNFIVGRRTEYTDADSAMEYYFDAMSAAYGFLFHSRFGPVRNPDDPQFSDAVDLYNRSLERLLRIADVRRQFVPGAPLHLPISGRSIQFVVSAGESSWEPRHYDRFRFVSDYDVEGLRTHHRARGLGVPLIAIRRAGADPPQVEQYYTDDLSFPITAFVRFHEAPARAEFGRTCQLELHNPYETQCVAVHDLVVPLETDISTPLAWFLDRPQFRYLDTWGLLRPDEVSPYSGLYMLQPYQPDKIPVLMVHGVWSSPMTWMPMMNDLMSRPEIRDRYQFWFYLYPTGEPFWFAAADLRDDLNELRDVFDPGRRNEAMDNMVVVGHSMGGLIARMLTQRSGDRYWCAVSRVPLDQAGFDPETREQVRRVYFFEPHPSVKRVVTIASPFRGSGYSNRFTRWLARSVISLPGRTLKTMGKVFRSGGRAELRAPTSFDGLDPNSPILRAIECSPLRADVAYHNIVAARKSWTGKLSDGVVDFPSATRHDVRSELVVEAAHSDVQRNQRTVNEVFRILMRHLQEVGAVAPLRFDHERAAQDIPPASPVRRITNPTPAPTRVGALPQAM